MKKEKVKIMLVFSLILVCGSIQAQNKVRYVYGISSRSANYVYLMGSMQFADSDSNAMETTDYFKVEKSRIIQDLNTNKIDNLKPKSFDVKKVQSIKELKQIVPQKQLEEFKKFFNLKSDNELIQYFNNHNNPASYPFFYKNKEIKIALGHVYEDKDVDSGQVFQYRVTRVKKDGGRELWGDRYIQSGEGNFILNNPKGEVSGIFANDSVMGFSWTVNISLEKILKGDINQTSKVSIALTEQIIQVLTADAKIFVTDINGNFKEAEYILLNKMDSAGNKLIFDYQIKTKPNQLGAAYIRLVDEVGNLGQPSDTAWAYSISDHRIPILQSMQSKSVVDGVRLSWDALPIQPYFSGIQISRSSGIDLSEVLAVLDYKDTTYVDNTIQPAKVYTYYAKALYSEGVTYKQEQPAQAVGQYTEFTIPEIPQNLTAINVGENVLLKWDSIANPGIHSYFIYKGIHPNKIELYKGPIETHRFIDSSQALSGGSVYYYQVRSQNLMQDRSDLSENVSIRPNKPVRMRIPENTSFYYENGNLQINWNDVRADDKLVKGYLVKKYEKTKVGTGKILTKVPINTTSFIDTNYVEGTTCFYSVAPVSIHGDTTGFSEPVPFMYERPRFDAVYDFELFNAKEAIVINIPAVDFGDDRRYKIYRRTSLETTMNELATLPKGQFEFLDKTAKEDETYVYSIRIVYADSKLGPFGSSNSIKRISK